MSGSLTEKVRKLEDEHFEAVEKTRIEDFDQEFIFEAHRFHGALGAVTSIARSLSSKMIEGLMQVEDKKYYLAWGYLRFVDYLNSDEVPDLSKTKYYDLKSLLLSEGADAFDVFSGKKIPISTRKLLASKGVEVSVDGDDLVIADRRVPITDRAAMKELVDTVHEVLRERDEREESKDKTIEKQADKIKKGSAEVNELQRAIDSINESTPFERALMGAVRAMITLTSEVKALPDDERAERADADLKTMAEQWFQLRDAYGVKVPFSERPADGPSGDFEAKLAAAIAEPDDLDDEGDE